MRNIPAGGFENSPRLSARSLTPASWEPTRRLVRRTDHAQKQSRRVTMPNDAELATRDVRAKGTYEAVGARVIIAG